MIHRPPSDPRARDIIGHILPSTEILDQTAYSPEKTYDQPARPIQSLPLIQLANPPTRQPYSPPPAPTDKPEWKATPTVLYTWRIGLSLGL